MFRAAIDTSVLIAAARSSRGASSLLIEWLEDSMSEAVISAPLALKYEEVLRREVQDVFLTGTEVTEVVDLAVAGLVDFIVTHNVRDFTGAAVHGVKAITPGRVIHLIRGGP